MSRRNRTSDLELNFDGLTDSVTNLVGALILIVVLLIGLTREITGKEISAPIRETAPPEEQLLSGERTVLDLLRQAEQLQTLIEITDQNIQQSETRVDELQSKIDGLLSDSTIEEI